MDDYSKLVSIHNWLSSNIYYDQDSLDFNSRGPNDGKGTFENKKAVCEGYAKLSLDLCRVNQIPCQLIYGYAIGVDDEDKEWTDSNLESSPNHAWNQAYVDGRWLIFDTTWDSNNKFKGGQFLEDKPSLNYFDPSLRFFSESHKIDKIIDI